MYEELIKALKNCNYPGCVYYCSHGCVMSQEGSTCELIPLLRKAANVIDELQKPKWIQFTSRELTEEEQEEHPEWCWILDCETPDDGQEILVSNDRHVWTDCYCNDGDDGVYLDGGNDVVGLWWMPIPEPPKVTEE